MTHYLDFAATSALRPPGVVSAMVGFLERCGGTPGRGGHTRALDAGRVALQARRALMAVLGLEGDPLRMVLTFNATHALNMALAGLLRTDDRVVCTDFDHNAVVRPLHALEATRGVRVCRVGGATDGSLDRAAFSRALDGARLVVLNAGANVLGTVLPVAELAAEARDAGALVLVDAAQTAGHVPMDLSNVDLVAVTGHKALLGPQGTGGLWVGPGVDLAPLLRGGTGGDSMDPDMPQALPDRLEAGTLNGPGLAGLEAGCRFVLDRGVESLREHGRAMKMRLHDGLAAVEGVQVLSPRAPEGLPIVTLAGRDVDPGTLAHRLEREYGVQARAGLHCAPGQHRLLGTTRTGALRLSPGWSTTASDVDRAVEGLAALTA